MSIEDIGLKGDIVKKHTGVVVVFRVVCGCRVWKDMVRPFIEGKFKTGGLNASGHIGLSLLDSRQLFVCVRNSVRLESRARWLSTVM